MYRLCFKKLCDALEQDVGEVEFMSEHFINTLPHTCLHKKRKMMHVAQDQSTGGFVSGEIKLAITLRLLEGASYLDLMLLHTCGHSSMCRIFHHVITNWTCRDEVFKIDCYNNLTDLNEMKKQQNNFHKKVEMQAYLVVLLKC